MIILLSCLACVTPTALYVGLIYGVDRYEKEPLWLLSAAFLWGAAPGVILAIILSTLLSGPIYLVAGEGFGELASATVVAPLVEESVKGAALLGILFFRRRDVDSLLDGIIYGAMVGLGFAMVENFFYFLNEYDSGGLSAWSLNVFLRAGVFGLNHALFTSMTGLGMAVARLTRRDGLKVVAPIVGWAAAVSLHLIHNLTTSILEGALCLLTLLNAWGGVLVTAIIIIWAVRQEGRWIRDYLPDEVLQGTLSPEQYAIAASPRLRWRAVWRVWRGEGFGRSRQVARFYQVVSKLAYQKQRDSHSAPSADAETLRAQVTQLSRQL